MHRTIRTSLLLLFFPVLLIQQSCAYKLTGASIPPEMKTVSVQFFENNATLVVPYLSQQFTDALKDRILSQSRLNMVRTEGDATFEGRITDYNIRPVAIQGNERAGLSRLSVTVSVKYTNTLKPDQSFEQSFTRFRDLDLSTRPLQVQERELITAINRELCEDIFNRAFANW